MAFVRTTRKEIFEAVIREMDHVFDRLIFAKCKSILSCSEEYSGLGSSSNVFFDKDFSSTIFIGLMEGMLDNWLSLDEKMDKFLKENIIEKFKKQCPLEDIENLTKAVSELSKNYKRLKDSILFLKSLLKGSKLKNLLPGNLSYQDSEIKAIANGLKQHGNLKDIWDKISMRLEADLQYFFSSHETALAVATIAGAPNAAGYRSINGKSSIPDLYLERMVICIMRDTLLNNIFNLLEGDFLDVFKEYMAVCEKAYDDLIKKATLLDNTYGEIIKDIEELFNAIGEKIKGTEYQLSGCLPAGSYIAWCGEKIDRLTSTYKFHCEVIKNVLGMFESQSYYPRKDGSINRAITPYEVEKVPGILLEFKKEVSNNSGKQSKIRCDIYFTIEKVAIFNMSCSSFQNDLTFIEKILFNNDVVCKITGTSPSNVTAREDYLEILKVFFRDRKAIPSIKSRLYSNIFQTPSPMVLYTLYPKDYVGRYIVRALLVDLLAKHLKKASADLTFNYSSKALPELLIVPLDGYHRIEVPTRISKAQSSAKQQASNNSSTTATAVSPHNQLPSSQQQQTSNSNSSTTATAGSPHNDASDNKSADGESNTKSSSKTEEHSNKNKEEKKEEKEGEKKESDAMVWIVIGSSTILVFLSVCGILVYRYRKKSG